MIIYQLVNQLFKLIIKNYKYNVVYIFLPFSILFFAFLIALILHIATFSNQYLIVKLNIEKKNILYEVQELSNQVNRMKTANNLYTMSKHLGMIESLNQDAYIDLNNKKVEYYSKQ